MDNIKEENERYIVKDSTSGGYADRMTYHYMQNWITVWDKNLNLISLSYNKIDLTDVILNKDKSHYEYHKVTRARGRHLKMLKEYLGMEVNKPKEKPQQKIIYRDKNGFSSLHDLNIAKGIIHDKTVEIGSSKHKKYAIHYTLLTEEKEELVKEYNLQLRAFKEFQKFMFEQIFEDYKL